MSNIIGNQVFSEEKKEFIQAWIFALLWNAFVSIIMIVTGQERLTEIARQDPIFYVFILFPVLGVWMLIDAAYKTKAWYKFGKTPVVLDPFPGQIGGQLAGYILLPIETKSAGPVKLTLTCIHRYYQRNNRSENKQHNDAIWHDTVTLKPDNLGRNSQVRFSFKLPDDCPASGNISNDYHFWQLNIEMSLPGINFSRSYNVPVEFNKSATISLHHTAKTSEIVTQADQHSTNYPQITRTAVGEQFYYGYGRNKGLAILVISFALVFGIVGGFFFEKFLDFLPVTASLLFVYVEVIALSMLAFGIFFITNSLTVSVNPDGIKKQQRIFGYNLEEKIEAENIVDIIAQESSSSSQGRTHHVWYSLKIFTADGREVEIADSLEGQSNADKIKQQMLAGLGRNWQSTRSATPANSVAASKAKPPLLIRLLIDNKKLISYPINLALLYDLASKALPIAEFFNQIKFSP